VYESHIIVIESMGANYNQFGEECKSSMQEEGKFVWVGNQNCTFTFLHEEQFLHRILWP
jgi:hypothetical protein